MRAGYDADLVAEAMAAALNGGASMSLVRAPVYLGPEVDGDYEPTTDAILTDARRRSRLLEDDWLCDRSDESGPYDIEADEPGRRAEIIPIVEPAEWVPNIILGGIGTVSASHILFGSRLRSAMPKLLRERVESLFEAKDEYESQVRHLTDSASADVGLADAECPFVGLADYCGCLFRVSHPVLDSMDGRIDEHVRTAALTLDNRIARVQQLLMLPTARQLALIQLKGRYNYVFGVGGGNSKLYPIYHLITHGIQVDDTEKWYGLHNVRLSRLCTDAATASMLLKLARWS